MKSERIQIKSTGDPKFPYLLVWPIDDAGFVRIIKVKQFKSTHTYFDPEEEDRKIFPTEIRIPIR